MAEAKTKIIIDTGEGAKSLKQLKQEFKDGQKELEGLTVGSKAYLDQLKKLAGVKDDIDDLNTAITAFRPDQKLAAIIGVGKGIASGFEAATAATALFGSKAEDVDKALKRVQAAMALSHAVQDVGELGKAFKLLGNIIKANPIMLIASILIAVGTAIYELKDKFKIFGQIVEAVSVIIKFLIDKFYAITDAIGITNTKLDEQGKTIVKNAQKAKDALNEQTASYDRQIKIASAAGKQTVDIELAKQQAILKTNKTIAEQIIAFVRAGGKLDEEQTKIFNEAKKAIEDASTEIAVIKAKKQKEADDKDKENVEKQKENNRKIREDYEANLKKKALEDQNALKQLEENRKAELEIERDYNVSLQEIDEQYAKIASQNAELSSKEIYALIKKGYDDKNQLLIKEAEDRKSAEKELQNNYDTQLGIQNKYKKSQQEVDDLYSQIAIQNTNLTSKEIYDIIAKQYDDEVAKAAQAEKDKQQVKKDSLAFAGEILQLTDELSQAFAGKDEESQRKAFEVSKAMHLAQATMSGIQSVQNAFTTASASPLTTIFPGYPFVQAGIAGAFALLQLNKIRQQQFKAAGGGIGGAGGAGGGGGVKAPSLGGVGSTSTNLDNLTSQGGKKEEKPMKAYVVETEISDSQKRVNKIIDKSKH